MSDTVDAKRREKFRADAKSELLELYKNKYYAKQINAQRMYIEPESGVKLINEYLNRKK